MGLLRPFYLPTKAGLDVLSELTRERVLCLGVGRGRLSNCVCRSESCVLHHLEHSIIMGRGMRFSG